MVHLIATKRPQVYYIFRLEVDKCYVHLIYVSEREKIVVKGSTSVRLYRIKTL